MPKRKISLRTLQTSYRELLAACRFARSVQKSHGMWDVSDRLNEEKLKLAIENAERILGK